MIILSKMFGLKTICAKKFHYCAYQCYLIDLLFFFFNLLAIFWSNDADMFKLSYIIVEIKFCRYLRFIIMPNINALRLNKVESFNAGLFQQEIISIRMKRFKTLLILKAYPNIKLFWILSKYLKHLQLERILIQF